MLPTPLTTPWSRSTRFTPLARRDECSDERLVGERRVERVPRDMGDLGGNRPLPLPRDVAREPGDLPVGGRNQTVDRERAEGALVEEVDAVLAVIGMLEVHPHARMTIVAIMVGGAQQQLPAHAEVTDDRAAARQRHPQELAASYGRLDARAGDEGFEVAGCRIVPRERARVEHLDRRDRGTGHRRCQSGPHDLDLGKLGHVSAGSGASTPRAPRPSRPASCSIPRRMPRRGRRP